MTGSGPALDHAATPGPSPTPVRPLARDRAAWRRLLDLTAGQVERAEGGVRSLARAARSAQGAVLPVAPYDRANPFVSLADAALAYADAPPLLRVARRPELADILARCRAAWPEGRASPPAARAPPAEAADRGWRARADIGDRD